MMHYAVTHQTAAEIVYDRANAEKPYMGLTSWKNAPDGRIRKSDVTVAKNYLSEKEVRSLELLSTAFVDIAELRAERQQLMSMKDWEEQLVKFLSINDHDILPDAGRWPPSSPRYNVTTQVSGSNFRERGKPSIPG